MTYGILIGMPGSKEKTEASQLIRNFYVNNKTVKILSTESNVVIFIPADLDLVFKYSC